MENNSNSCHKTKSNLTKVQMDKDNLKRLSKAQIIKLFLQQQKLNEV